MDSDTAPLPLLHPNLAETYRRKVAALRDTLGGPNGNSEAIELIRSLVEAIMLTPENGRLRIDIKGELAGILALCRDARMNKPGRLTTVGLAEQIKMVAGERNHLYRTTVVHRGGKP